MFKMNQSGLETPTRPHDFLIGSQNNAYADDGDYSNDNSDDTLIVFSSSIEDSSLESQARKELRNFMHQSRRNKIKRTSLSATSSPYLSQGTPIQSNHPYYSNQHYGHYYQRSHSSNTASGTTKSTKRLGFPATFFNHRGSETGLHQLSQQSNGPGSNGHHFRPSYSYGSNWFQRKPSTSSLGGSSVGSCGGSSEILSDSKPFLCTAIYDYTANGHDELSLKRGEVVTVLSKDATISGGEGWWAGRLHDGRVGIFPADFLQELESNLLDEVKPVEIPFSDLTIGKFIGMGGFGQVHVGWWKGCEVAIKRHDTNTSDSIEKAIDSVRQEAKLFWLLRHENIVGLRGVCYDPSNLCLVMDYERGGSLNRVLGRRNIQIPQEILLDWAIQIAEGMNYLHTGAPISLIHRDLKSSNVLVNEEIVGEDFSGKTLKITDFGLARESYRTTMMSAAGTYSYMSPEVINKSTFSTASDVWSYGVVLWELLTGETPYKGMEGIAVAYQVGAKKLTLPIPKTCPADWRSLMEECWRLDPHERPSFGQLLTKLRNLSTTFLGEESFYVMQSTWKAEVNEALEAKRKEIQSREEEVRQIDLYQKNRAQELRQREQELAAREMDLLQRELSIQMLQPVKETFVPVPKTRMGKFRRKALKNHMLISNPSDFRHTLSVQTAERKKKEGRSFSSPESLPASPNTPMRAIVLPPDGVKGRTWGPSSFHQKERGTILTKGSESESPKRWSKSAPNLEKSQRSSSSPGRTLESLDYGGESPKTGSRIPFSGRNYSSVGGELRKPSKFGSVQKAFCDMTSLLANIVLGQSVRKNASPSQIKNGEPSEGSPRQVILMDGVRNAGFGVGEETSRAVSTTVFNTYHGHTRHHNRQRLYSSPANVEIPDHVKPIRFTDDIPSRTPSPPSQPQIHLSSEQLKRQTKYPPFSTPPSQRSRFDSPITNESEINGNGILEQIDVTDSSTSTLSSCCLFSSHTQLVTVSDDMNGSDSGYNQKKRKNGSKSTATVTIFYPAHTSSYFDDYVDTHYSTEEMHQHPHPPAYQTRSHHHHRPQIHRSGYSSEPFQSPETGTLEFHSEHSETHLQHHPQGASLSYQTLSHPLIHVHPEAVYRMEMANNGTTELLGYSTPSQRTRSYQTLQPTQLSTSYDGESHFASTPPLHHRSYGYPYRTTLTPSPGGLSRQNSLESQPLMTERPITLDLPRPLRSSLRKYNYSPAAASLNTPGLSSITSGSGTWTDSGTPPDSSLSEDSSYVSARESSPSFTSQHSSANRSVRFSPMTLDSLPRENLMMDMKGETLLELAERNRLEAFGSSPRTDYNSPLRRLDYDKMEFLYNF